MSEIKEEEELSIPVPHNIEATSTTSALEILSKLNFKSVNYENQKIFHIKVKITGKIDETLNEACFAHCFDVSSSVLIAFKSENKVKIFWKTSTREKFFSIQICNIFNEITSDYCEQFLINELIENKNGILSKSEGSRNINLQDIGNDKDQNLLILAAIDNRDDVVAELLKHDFNVDDEDHDGNNAIEKAWMNCMNASNLEIKDKCFEIILSLLKNNSKYPRKIQIKSENKNFEFNYENCSQLIKNFVDYSEKIHNLVTESNLEELKLELEKEPNLYYFYDRNNKSLMAHAIESKDLEIWKLLISLRLSSGHHEIQNLGDFYEKYESDSEELEEIQSEHQLYARKLPSSHIHFLLTCSNIGNNDRRCDERWNLVEEAFRIMDTDESCSKILKIAAKWKKLTIYFDFKHDTAYYLDPMTQYGSSGIIYESGTIYIGAKNLVDNKMKYEVISVIIHELCHLAVNFTYFNNFDPYPKGESEEKRRFEEEVVPECEENGHPKEIVGGVAWYYPEEYHHSEYIVRIVQMLMHYYVQNPSIECENSKILKNLREKFGKLFEYFKDVVEKDFDDFLGIIDTLLDEYKDIKYEQLTGPMKARIFHSEVNFQGQETTLHDIIENNEEILNKMTPTQIRDMLIRGECIKIGNKHISNTKISAIERTFTTPKLYNYKNMSEIQNEVENSKILILSALAGAGKTTTFEQLTEILKKGNKNWVCFIKLRAHRLIFDSYNRSREINLEDVLKLLIDIQDLKGNLEVEIFKFLFKNDKVILLLDGVDEISPDYNEFMVEILKVLKENTKNQLWISSRPQCAKMLEDNLNVQAYNFEPYTIEERLIFINEIYDNYYITSEKTPIDDLKTITVNTLNEFFESLERNRYNGDYLSEVNNPLIIKTITELYIEKPNDLNPESANYFEIFDKVTEELRKEVGQKVESEDNNSFITFNLGHVYQMLALKYLFKYKDIKDLSKMNEWKEKRTKWSVDRIQRFGFVMLDARFDKDPRRNYIDFIHRTYADFFAAQFIISIVFETNCDDLKNNKDFKILLELINTIEISGDSSIAKFLLSYMQSNRNRKIKGNKNIEWFCELFENFIMNQQDNINEEKILKFSLIEFIFVILSNNPTIIKLVWKLKEPQNSLNHILFNTGLEIKKICEILQISFGVNWDEKFNKIDDKFKFEFANENVKFDVKSELKFFEFVESNFNISERCEIYSNHRIFSTFFEMKESIKKVVLEKMFMRFVEISTDAEEEAFFQVTKEFIYDFESIEILIFLKDKCENLIKNCSENHKKFLSRYENYTTDLIIRNTSRFSNDRFLRLCSIKNVWINNENLKNKLKKNLSEKKLWIENCCDENFQETKEVLLEIFKDCPLEVMEIFHYYQIDNLLLKEEKYNKFENFLLSFNDSNLKSVFASKILSENLRCDQLLRVMKGGKESFKRLINIYLFDKQNYEKVQKFLLSGDNYFSEFFMSKILSNMNDEIYPDFMEFISKIFANNKNILMQFMIESHIYKPIESEEKFAIFFNFLHEVFDQNFPITAKCMRRNLLKYFSQNQFNFDPHTFGISVARTLEILTIYGKYSDDAYVDLYDNLKNKNIFLEIISELSDESCEHFIKICIKMFSQFKPHPDKCLRCYNQPALVFLENKEKMKNLDKFLDAIYDENEIRKYVKRNLIYDNFHYFLCNAIQDVDKFQTLIKLSNENNCLEEKLREKLISRKSLIDIFNYTPKENYSMIAKYLGKIFVSNKEQIIETIGYPLISNSKSFYNLKKNKNLIFFDQFLMDIYGSDNKNVLDMCKIKIFRYIYDVMRITREVEENDDSDPSCTCIKYYETKEEEIINELYEIFICNDHDSILWMFYYENLEEIKILTDLTKNNINHWEWAQDLFLDKFPFESIQRMSIETYDALENFLKLVFKSNKKKLNEEIQNKYLNDEIINNENENCKKFVKTFLNFNEN